MNMQKNSSETTKIRSLTTKLINSEKRVVMLRVKLRLFKEFLHDEKLEQLFGEYLAERELNS